MFQWRGCSLRVTVLTSLIVILVLDICNFGLASYFIASESYDDPSKVKIIASVLGCFIGINLVHMSVTIEALFYTYKTIRKGLIRWFFATFLEYAALILLFIIGGVYSYYALIGMAGVSVLILVVVHFMTCNRPPENKTRYNMSDFMITIGVIKVMFSTLLFVSALLFALNRTSVQDYFSKQVTKKIDQGGNKADEEIRAHEIVTDYITVLVFMMTASVMRMISATAVFAGEYSEMIEVRIVGITSYFLDVTFLGIFMWYFTPRVHIHFQSFLSLPLTAICGTEFIIFLCMCIATAFSLHEFEFKAKWEELKRKRKVMKARKAKKAAAAAATTAQPAK